MAFRLMVRGRGEKPNPYLAAFSPDGFALHFDAIQFDNKLEVVWNMGAVH